MWSKDVSEFYFTFTCHCTVHLDESSENAMVRIYADCWMSTARDRYYNIIEIEDNFWESDLMTQTIQMVPLALYKQNFRNSPMPMYMHIAQICLHVGLTLWANTSRLIPHCWLCWMLLKRLCRQVIIVSGLLVNYLCINQTLC